MARRATSGTKKKKHSRIFEQINHNAAGIDAGAELHWVAVPEERASPSVRKFSTLTAGLYELADWLVEVKVDTVAVEATGVYCVPLLEVLEARGIKVLLAKPSSLKSVNDHQKSDMSDCQWLQVLHTFALLKPSFRPTQLVATFRAYSRQRRMLIEAASTSIEHMKKALTQMNVRVDQAVTDVTGVTGMKIIRAILAGKRDPQYLASLRDPRCALSEEGIAEALLGKYSDEHLFALDQAVRTWDHYQVLIAECNRRIEEHSDTFEKKASRQDIPKPRRVEHLRKNVLPFDARSIFFELLGQDLTQIDGISTGTICTFIAEVGTTVEAFPNEKNFTSWLRICPGSNITGGKNRSGKNRSTTNRLTTALQVAAQSLERSKSANGAFFRRKKAQLGPEKAITATAHRLARMIYTTLKLQRPYVDPGPDYYYQKNRDKFFKSLQKRAKEMGYTLVEAA